MFDFLKKKIKSWIGTPVETTKKGKTKKQKEKKAKAKAVKKTKSKGKATKLVEEAKQDLETFSEVPETVEERVEEIQEEKAQVIEEKPSFFSKLFSKIKTSTLTKDNVEEIFQDLEIILLENNVALEVVDKIKENLIKDLVGIEVKKDKIQETILSSLKESISQVLIEPPDLIKAINRKLGVYTMIFFGINGTGKTTSIAKLAHKLKKEGISCVLAAGDTFRAAAIQQLETHAHKLGIPIIKHDYNSDPTAVAFDAVKYAEKNNIKCVLIDTAGRMYTKENLIKQMEKIIRVIKPDLKIFVGEATTGNDAIDQVKTFNEAVGIDGIILSKADVDQKGGTALSVSYTTGKPIYFLGVGQGYDDLQTFKKDIILKNLGLQ